MPIEVLFKPASMYRRDPDKKELVEKEVQESPKLPEGTVSATVV